MKTLYKSLPKNLSPHRHKFVVGKWYKENNISICHRGFHASKRAIDAMSYVNCEVLALVEVRGKSEKEKDKECWSEMRLVKTYKWTKKDSIALAIYSAELVIDNFEKKYPDDDRPRKAIEAAKLVLQNDTVKNKFAAQSAAESAESAALSARYTAWYAEFAAQFAAQSAAEVARYAEFAVWSAAESAAISAKSAAEVAQSTTEYTAQSAAEVAQFAAKSARYAAISAKSAEKCINKIEKWIHNRIGF